MKPSVILVVTLATAMVAGGATLAQQVKPVKEDPGPVGLMGQAKVLVINTGAKQAIPVSFDGADAVKVQVTGTAAVQIAGTPPVQARTMRQSWEYKQITLPVGQDPTNTLNAAGLDGWEATGIAFTTTDATRIILKRPTDR
jgi:hypothetical protein